MGNNLMWSGYLVDIHVECYTVRKDKNPTAV